jgi:hypothetical protein
VVDDAFFQRTFRPESTGCLEEEGRHYGC